MDYEKLAQSLALEVVGAVEKEAVDKVAVRPETEMFVEWCIMKNDRLTKRECERFLERQGVPHKEYKPGTSKRGKPLDKGEMVRVDKRKVPGHLADVLIDAYHEQVATVIEVDGDDVILKFEHPRLPDMLRVDGGAKGPKAGLYRHTPASAARGVVLGGEKRPSKLFEVVYFKDPKTMPSPDRVRQVQEYVDRGVDKGESRSRNYYTGLILHSYMGKGGTDKDWIFRLMAQQRQTYPTGINPTKGRVLYLGRLRDRPSGWLEEYQEMVAAAAVEEDE